MRGARSAVREETSSSFGARFVHARECGGGSAVCSLGGERMESCGFVIGSGSIGGILWFEFCTGHVR